MVNMVKGTHSRYIKNVNYECHACGLILPFDPNPIHVCPKCGGGMQRVVDKVKVPRPKKHPWCQKCSGSGAMMKGDVGGIPIMSPCPECKGSGRL